MSDFIGCLESTSFRVRDREAWLADPVVVKVREKALHSAHSGFFEEEDGRWAFGWYDQYPSPILTEWDHEANDEKEYDLLAAVQRHIRPGDVCQVGVSGNEKLRYIGGGLWFVTSRGVAHFEGTTQWDVTLTPNALRKDVRRFLGEVTRITTPERPARGTRRRTNG